MPYDEGGELAELYALGAPIELARGHGRGVFIRARLPRRELRRFASFLVAEAERQRRPQRPVIELPVTRLRDDAVVPGRAYAGDAGSTSPRASTSSSAPGERASSAPASRSRSRTGYAGLRPAALGARRGHGITIVNAPGLVDSGYRGELRVDRC